MKTGFQKQVNSNPVILADIGDPYPGRDELLQYYNYIDPAFQVPAIKSWGGDNYGQLGTSSTGNVSVPSSVGALSNWRQVSAGGIHAAAVKTDGTMWTWGNNDYGQLGDNSYTYRSSPVQIGSLTNWQQVSAGYTHTVAISTDGNLWAWGSNYYTQLATATLPTITLSYLTPSAGPTITVPNDWSSVNTVQVQGGGGGGSWGGSITAFGGNPTYNYPGDGGGGGGYARQYNIALTPGSSISFSVGSGGTGGVAPTANGDFTSPSGTGGGISQFGTVIANGGGGSSRLSGSPTVGAGGTASGGYVNTTGGSGGVYSDPTGGSGGIAGGGGGAAAANTSGVSGGGGGGGNRTIPGTPGGAGGSGNVLISYSPTFSKSPVQVGTDNTWQQVSAGGYHTMAIKKDGTLWGWGLNTSYQTGQFSPTIISTPTQITSPAVTWISVSAGWQHNLAISATGALYSWGSNKYGQLGQNNTTDWPIPLNVGAATDWRSISSRGASSAAIKTDNSMYTWGFNGQSNLGLGDLVNRSSPVQVGTLKNWARVSMGLYNAAAIKNDGSMWTWGYNQNGELGLGYSGVSAYSTTPVQIGQLTNWKAVSVGGAPEDVLKPLLNYNVVVQGFTVSVVSATDF
jgi:alpha-tubulin suppressor-like RCC1 family protein